MSGNRMRCLAMSLILVIAFCGCGMKKTEGKESNPSSPFGYKIATSDWKDNSLDAFSARFMASATPSESEEGFSYGGWNVVLSDTKTYVLQKHLCTEDYAKSWDEMITVDDRGEVTHEKLILSYTPESNDQIVIMGRVFGSDHLLCVNTENTEQGIQWRVFELDENFQPLWDFDANFLEDGANYFPRCALRDGDGRIHLAFHSTEGTGRLTHYVLSQDGTVLDSLVMEGSVNDAGVFYEWMLSASGSLLIKQTTYHGPNATERLYLGLSGEGLGRLLAETELDLSKPYSRKYVLLNEDVTKGGDRTFLCADVFGVHYCNPALESNECLYQWDNHGVSIREIKDVRLYEGGNFGVFYREKGGDRFVILEPTTEQRDPVEPVEITLYAMEGRRLYYDALVNEFNRKNPGWKVRVRSDYDETRLLAELGTGNGPVLVDTLRLGFEEQKKLWEPLDELLEYANLGDELLEGIMEGCKIDGVTYGVALDCQLETMITHAGITPDKWNYEGFLDHAEDPKLKALYPSYDTDARSLMTTYLMMHGIDDNYLINAEDFKNCINEKQLNRALDIADRLCNHLDVGQDWAKAFRDGEILCYRSALRTVIFVTNLRNKYGKDISFVGLPTKDGGKNLMSAVIPLAIRASASDQEKEVARAFLLEAVSYDGQMTEIENNYNFGISIRKDLFEYQIERDLANYLEQEGLYQISESLKEDAKIWRKLVNEAVAKRSMPSDLADILDEEFDAYFQNGITRRQLLERLEKRVGLYLSENMQ